MLSNKKSSVSMQLKLLAVMSNYNQGHTIHESCKLASISLHTYYRWRKMNSHICIDETFLPDSEIKDDSTI